MKKIISHNFLMRALRLQDKPCNKNKEIIVERDGSVRMNYANAQVRKDITNKMYEFSKLKID